jgi:hypothetical protein
VLRRIAFLIGALALLLPGTALADVPAGTWAITGIELNGTHIDAKGTIGFEATGLSASVGCNSIGGPASVDGNGMLTFSGDLVTTDIACPKDLAVAEDALMKILSGGPIDITGPQWSNAVGEIDVVSLDLPDPGTISGGGAPGCIPPVAPGANPGNVTVPCGNGSGSDVGGGSTVETSGPTGGGDPLLLAGFVGIGILIAATIAAFIYLGPRRAPGGGPQE